MLQIQKHPDRQYRLIKRCKELSSGFVGRGPILKRDCSASLSKLVEGKFGKERQ